MAKWTVKKCSADPKRLMSFYGCGKPLAYALYNRGIRDRDRLRAYTDTDNFIFEPFTDFKDAEKAFAIVKNAIDKGSKICIYGDYDVDGVMSTVILYKGLSALGADVTYNIPHRVEDGYGLGENAVGSMKDIDLLITCDNGISSSGAVALAKSEGMEVIILDHHEPSFTEREGKREDILPPADAVIDAKTENCGYSFTQMCAGALCFRFIKSFYEYMGSELYNENELLIFAAAATVCDVVDLVGENRAIAKKGIELINKDIPNIGLKKLVELRDIKNISAYHIGFIIGPCINAGGRLDTAKTAVELFTTDDEEKAEELAAVLIDYNEERKDMTAKGVEEITELIEGSSLAKDRVIVALSYNIHESIAGIIAGRIKEKYYRPTIVLTPTEKAVKGSGRSIDAYNMFEELYKVKDIMLKFGGHTMAAGLSIEEKNVALLRKMLNENCTLTDRDMEPVIRLDAQLYLDDITVESIEELDVLHPYGKANERPVFGSKDMTFLFVKFVGREKNIVSLTVEDSSGRRIRAVDFDNCGIWLDKIEKLGFNINNSYSARLTGDIAYTLDINEFNGSRNPQMIIKDVRFNK